MKIIIGSDHRGFLLKEKIKKFLEKDYRVKDVGTFSQKRCDYPDFVLKLVKEMKKNCRGIFICMTGIGSSIALNRFKHIRAALVLNQDMAFFSRAHNNSNVLVLGAKYTSFNKVKKILKIWLNTKFEKGRHLRRVKKLKELG